MIYFMQEMKGDILMKKALAIILSIMFVFTVTGCGSSNKENLKPKDVKDKYIAKKTELKDLPKYPGSILVYDNQSLWGDENCAYWSWTYVTTGSANEIIDFFEKEFVNLGYSISEKSTPGSKFFMRVEESDFYINSSSWDKENNKKLPDEVTPETPGREYEIIVNLDKWNNR